MFRIKFGSAHRRLKVKAQPFLNASHACTLGKIEKQDQIKDYERSQNRVAAQEIDFDLHRIAQPAEDVDVVPALFVVPARRIVVDADLMVNLAIKVRIEFRLQNVLKNSQLRFFL